jgi:hypothetical protein
MYLAALLGEINIYGRVYEPCCGDGAIVQALRQLPAVRAVTTNDIDTSCQADRHLDATEITAWAGTFDWIVTNGPFSDLLLILDHALECCSNVAFLARLSFLEPTAEREYLLESNPPQRVIVLPRYSFRLNDAGKLQTDTVTCCWLVWGTAVQPGVSVWSKGKAQAQAVLQELL